MIRQELESILGKELRLLAIKTRAHLGYTQREMSEKLEMSESSYSDIETGRSKCSMLTAVLLLRMQKDPDEFLKKLEEKIPLKYAEIVAVMI